jgi:hypothetical protein
LSKHMQTARQPALRITPAMRKEIVEIIDNRIREVHVTKEDFSELKAIVRDIGVKVGELTEAQKRTEITVEKLAKGLDATRTELGGLSRSVSYSLENEAYRQLPFFLKEHYNIDVTDKMVRLEMEGEEINIFAHGRRDGKDILIVGETQLKLSSVGKLRQLEKKVSLIQRHYPGDCIPLLITHFARPAVLDAAKEKGIVVVQSFEW